jgi:type II secretory ATPase GspE/PulE/Tfp pilus assembly ATPase PilB-like protein
MMGLELLGDLAHPAAGAMLANAVPAFLLSFYKPVLILLAVVPFSWLASSVIEKDVRFFNFPLATWNWALVGTLLAGLAAALFIPIFWVGWPLQVLMYAGLGYGYWTYRDKQVPEKSRFDLFSAKFRASMESRKAAKAFAGATILFLDSAGNKVPVPAREDPMAEVHSAAEQMIATALPARARRIDLGPTPKGYVPIRLVDGIKHPQEAMQPELALRVIDYIKRVAGLDVNERRKRQMKDMKIQAAGGRVLLTLTTWGGANGQALRIDIEREKQLAIAFDSLGMLPVQVQALEEATKDVSQGLVLVSAPPGMGLTTLSYALIARHDPYLLNIKTLERLIERRVEGVEQEQFDASAPGAEYATRLQSLVRRAPNVMMVSDVQDPGTGKIITNPNAGETLFYACMPADSAVAAATAWARAVGDTSLAAARLRAIVVGRQVRSLCTECRQPYQASPEQAKRLGAPAGKPLQLYRAGGKVQVKNRIEECPACGGLGFVGTTGVFEVLRLDDAARKALASGDVAAMYQAARRAFRTPMIQEAAMAKVCSGLTSIEEVARVFAPKAAASAGATGAAAPRAAAPAAPATASPAAAKPAAGQSARPAAGTAPAKAPAARPSAPGKPGGTPRPPA